MASVFGWLLFSRCYVTTCEMLKLMKCFIFVTKVKLIIKVLLVSFLLLIKTVMP